MMRSWTSFAICCDTALTQERNISIMPKDQNNYETTYYNAEEVRR